MLNLNKEEYMRYYGYMLTYQKKHNLEVEYDIAKQDNVYYNATMRFTFEEFVKALKAKGV